MNVTILTLFPDFFSSPFSVSIIKRAKEQGHIALNFVNIRDFAKDKYKTVDDHPYGGGAGMILKVDILDNALKSVSTVGKSQRILLDPQGKTYTQQTAKKLSTLDHLVLVCGHYEGVDERVRTLVDEEISIGDYVLTGGETAALVIVDSVVRLIPGVLSKPESVLFESFEQGLLEYPQYTKPLEFNGKKVPPILLSGNHKAINDWKTTQARIRTKKKRPDLF